ncbi:HNH endonuclease signature motif containing protein [Bradyrhizobium sp. CCBAU 11357]|uniref:HNH endonuclease signature motif containing protein n=1 Tax=Bradyrhizobium sp. CCBAU 11357 TaxID=1630808 RepID=UPI0023032549|nr:HNH endonuclease signature motif containing protein [Bradyrhizobium sp. CCBAU 11357]
MTDYDAYLRSEQWRTKADAVIEREHGGCQRCGDSAWEMHHRDYERIFRERLEDLEAVCADCHKLEHGLSSAADADRQTRKQQAHRERLIRELYAPNRGKTWTAF